MKNYIAVIDYGLGNLTSVKNALIKLNIPVLITDSSEEIEKASGIILPGVGAAGAGMKNLKQKELAILISENIKKGKAFLGICLGMQLLFDSSEENKTQCLGLISGKVKKFDRSMKIPQVGWNQVDFKNSKSRLTKNIPDNSYFYFVNSFYPSPTDQSLVLGVTDYEGDFCSALEKGNIFATQFHPEKSGEVGLLVLRNFWGVCQ